jgi:hypothetical protein
VSATLIDEEQLGGVQRTPATITLQVALKNTSRSVADLPPFSWSSSSTLWLGTRWID